jgi:hypothetical protein
LSQLACDLHYPSYHPAHLQVRIVRYYPLILVSKVYIFFTRYRTYNHNPQANIATLTPPRSTSRGNDVEHMFHALITCEESNGNKIFMLPYPDLYPSSSYPSSNSLSFLYASHLSPDCSALGHWDGPLHSTSQKRQLTSALRPPETEDPLDACFACPSACIRERHPIQAEREISKGLMCIKIINKRAGKAIREGAMGKKRTSPLAKSCYYSLKKTMLT